MATRAKRYGRQGAGALLYNDCSADRFRQTFAKVIGRNSDRRAKVLDVGRSHFSRLLLEYYDTVATLGYPLDVTEPTQLSEGWEPPVGKHYSAHIACDLNAPDDTAADPQPEYDLVILAEVVEHLFLAPEIALRHLKKYLKPSGLMVCTTPNAASITKRLKLLAGRNPFERLVTNRFLLNHIREYTRSELVEIGSTCGLETVRHDYLEFVVPVRSIVLSAAHAVTRAAARVVPSFSRDQLIVYRPI